MNEHGIDLSHFTPHYNRAMDMRYSGDWNLSMFGLACSVAALLKDEGMTAALLKWRHLERLVNVEAANTASWKGTWSEGFRSTIEN